MPSSLRTVAIAAISSLGLVLYLVLWFRWPVTLSLAAGALMATVVVMTSASLGADPAEADAAWRAAAPDLAERTPESDGREPVERDGEGPG
jgi:hypothetical protein